jgi:hypothetical protein
VVLDTTDGPMRVTAQADSSFVPPGSSVAPSRTGELCLTPCAADLPTGRYRLFMSSVDGEHGDTDDLIVREGTTVYRRAPGKYETPSISNRVPAALVLSLGLVLTSVGLVVAAGSSTSSQSSSMTGGLLLTGLGGAIAVGGGFWLYDASRAVRQSGATTVWQP